MANREFEYGVPASEHNLELGMLMSQEVARVGETVLVAGGFGDFYESLDDVVASISLDHPDRDNLITALSGLGFGGGFKNRGDLGPEDERYFTRMGDVATSAILTAMEERGWDGIDIAVVASSSANMLVPEMIVEGAQSKGRTVASTLSIAQACNSAGEAVNHLLRSPEYRGARAVVLAIEALSGKAVNQEDYVTRQTFGNAYGAFAFIPGEDLVQIMGANTYVEQDREGVIRAPEIFHAGHKGDIGDNIGSLPSWYRMVGDQLDEDFIRQTSRGIFLNLPVADTLTMDGPKTFTYFSSRVPDIELEVLANYYRDIKGRHIFGVEMGDLGMTIAHMPSHIVHRTKCTQVERLRRAKAKGDPFYNSFAIPESPWFMDRVGHNNSSAATFLVNLTHMANGMIHPRTPSLWLTYGAGSAITAGVNMFL